MYTIEISAYNKVVRLHKDSKKRALCSMIDIITMHIDSKSKDPMGLVIFDTTKVVIAYVNL
jgi:hypothetical protein